MLPSIGRLKIVPIRQVFKDEARDFTPWLETNIDALSERLGIKLSDVQREKTVGAFNVDLYCSDGAGRLVIIENQLEQTDHGHLGQLLTYAINLDANVAIWITPNPRPEHEKVINSLNEFAFPNISFYLVKVEAVQIEGSPSYAPLFSILAAPNEQAKETGEAKKDWADRHYHREAFWKALLERSRSKTKLFSTIKPGKDNWLMTGIGRSWAYLQYVIRMGDGEVMLLVDCGPGQYEQTKRVYDALFSDKDAIEADFASPLEWDFQPARRSQRIHKQCMSGSLKDESTWPALQDEMIEAMIRLDRAFRSRVMKIDA
jgi:hypothetical protein